MTCFDSGISKKDYEKRLKYILSRYDNEVVPEEDTISELRLMIEELLESLE